MSKFVTEPAFRIKAANKYELITDLVYRSDFLQREITIPRGFVTDWASIPRVFWTIASPVDDAQLSGTLHDFLYSLQGRTGISRKDADRVFYEAMGVDVVPVPMWKRLAMYYSLRAFGYLAWSNKKFL